MTTTHTEIVQAARYLHDEIRDALRGQAQDIFDNPTPFHPSNHVFDDHTGAGDEMIEEPIRHAQSGDSSELAPRLPCKGKSVRNRGVSQTMPFLVIPRSLLRGGFI